MRTCNRNFPGVARETSERLASEVWEDERAFVDAIAALRQKEASTLEAIGFLMGADPAQISRYLKGTSSTTLANYIRIARALGYRTRLVLEKAESTNGGAEMLSDLRIPSHKVHRTRG